MSNIYILHTNNLTCTSCAGKIEADVQSLKEITSFKINLISQKATVESATDVTEVINKIVQRYEPDVTFTKAEQATGIHFPKRLIFITALFLISMVITRLIETQSFHYASVLFYIGIYVFAGKNVIRSFFVNLKSGDFFDENFLMFIATAGAIGIGAYEEAAGVMLFYNIGETFEGIAVDRSNKEIMALANLKPDTAWKVSDFGITQISSEEIKAGDKLLVKVGEMVPVDGVIIQGASDIDTSFITGESAPTWMEKTDQIMSGTIPLNAAITIQTSVDYGNATTTQIEKMIQDATDNKSNTEKFITKFSRIYTPVVVALAALVILVPISLKMLSIGSFDAPASSYLYNGLIFLVISCPCALVLSVPLTYFAGIGKSAKQGILVKGSAVLEELRHANTFVFDKTGTITEGRFSLKQTVQFDTQFNENDILKQVAAVEQYSTHPIASAFHQIDTNGIDVTGATEIAGEGMTGTIDGHQIAIGNPRMLERLKIELPNTPLDKGLTLFVVMENKLSALIRLEDHIKSDAPETIGYLHQNGFQTAMLSGDTESNVSSVANTLGVTEYHHSLLPSEKTERMNAYRKPDKPIVAVGDGINDALLLAESDIGIAMGNTGAAISVEVADIILLGNTLGKLKSILKIAKKTHRVVMENIIFIMAVKISIMTLGALGYATLWEAVIADVGVALITVLNSIKIFRHYI